jgi:hypothetical protein
MRRLLLVPLLCSGLLAVTAAPARACINDREVEQHEREFKSDYMKQPGSPGSTTEEAPPPSDGNWLIGASGLGVGLLAGALVLGVTRPSGRR